MGKIFFTSDQHFGHGNIIQYCSRPFSSTKEMDDTLIANHNKVVKQYDEVYMLGDFTLDSLSKAKEYFSRLNGNLFIIANVWHHDKRWIKPLLHSLLNRQGFVRCPARIDSANGYVDLLQPIRVLKIDNQVVVLSHYPQKYWDRKHHGSWHLHGHSHGKRMFDGYSEDLMMDVGVDANNFTPIEWQDVKKIFNLAIGEDENED